MHRFHFPFILTLFKQATLFLTMELLAKVRNLPFDRLRVNELRVKLFSFSVRGELVEPQKNTFARASMVRLLLEEKK